LPVAPARTHPKAVAIPYLTRELVPTPLSPVPYVLRVLGSPPEPSFLRTPLFEEEKEEDDLAMEFGEEGEESTDLKRMSAGSYESEESFGNQPGEDGISGLGVELDEVDEGALLALLFLFERPSSNTLQSVADLVPPSSYCCRGVPSTSSLPLKHLLLLLLLDVLLGAHLLSSPSALRSSSPSPIRCRRSTVLPPPATRLCSSIALLLLPAPAFFF
jgi:hypothetical protein